VNRGNLVQANSTQLTTIVSIDPIYAYFNVDEASVIRFQKAIEAGQFVGPRQATLSIWLQLDTEIGYPHQGVIDFVDNSFDPSRPVAESTRLLSNSWSLRHCPDGRIPEI